MFKNFFGKCGVSAMTTFNLMVMFQSVDSETTDETWEGTVKSIKKHVTSQISKLYAKVA